MKKILNKLSILSILSNTLSVVILTLILFLLSQESSYSQTALDTAITVSIENYSVNPVENYSEFDIYIARNNDAWQYWENATFQLLLYVSGSIQINYSNFTSAVVYGSSEVMIKAGTDVYQIDSKIMDDRLMIICTHRDTSYEGLPMFNKDAKLRLCKLRIQGKDSSAVLPHNINWAVPLDYYQSIAYKYVQYVDDKPIYIVDSRNEDNMEVGKTTRFTVNTINPLPITMWIDYFRARYVGNLNVVLDYATTSEYMNKGFVIKKCVNPGFTTDYESLADAYFTEVIGDYRNSDFANRMTGLYTSADGKIYDPIPDKIEYRTVSYLYRLYYQEDDGSDTIKKLATTELRTPNFVIVKTEAAPNPFVEKTRVRYVLEDDVYMTCEVYDALGRKVKNLSDSKNGILDKTFVKLGEHYVDFYAPELAMQGLYEIVFTAYPINDPYLEIARSYVKVQYVKE